MLIALLVILLCISVALVEYNFGTKAAAILLLAIILLYCLS